MQNFTPERKALHDIDKLPCVVVRKTCAATNAANGEAVCALFVPYLSRVEILLQVADHAIA